MKTLLIEDNPADARYIRELLAEARGEDFQVLHERRLEPALRRVRQDSFDVVLLDLGLPDSQGLGTLVHTQAAERALPVVVLTGLDDEGIAMEALRAGAQDYLVKGRFDRESLVRTMRYAVERQRAQAEIRRLNAELEQRVAARTIELQTANDELRRELAERKRAEEALRESEGRYRALAENSPSTIGRFDRQHRFVYLNPAAHVLLRPPAGVLGQSARELGLPAELCARWEQCQERAFAGERVCMQFELTDPQGRKHFIWDTYVPEPGADGSVHTVLVVSRDITEFIEAEQALRASEAKYHIVADNAYDWEFWRAPDGSFIYCSPSCERITARRAEEFIDNPGLHAELIHPDDRRRFDEHFREVEARRALGRGEWRIRRPDGSWRWIAHVCQPVFDEQGVYLGCRGSNRDITEHKQAEENLRESEQRYRGIVETAEEGIAAHEPDGTISYVNQRMADMLGYARAELLGRSSLAFVDDEEKEAVRRARASLQARGSFSAERRLRRKDGSTLWTLSNLSPRRDGAGNFVGYLAMYTDITARKRGEEAVRAAERQARARAAQLQAVLDSAPAIIWIAQDRECRGITGNRAAFEFSRVPIGQNLSQTGPSPEHLAHYHVFENGRELAAQELPMQRVAASGQAIRDCAIEFHFDNGTARSLLGNVVPTLDADGQPDGAIAAFIDVTELRQLQSEREAMLSSERAARTEAERASRMKDDFVAVLSHELRNPLNVILGWVQLLRRAQSLPAEAYEGIDAIHSSGRVLADMVSDLLDLSRITAGKLRLDVRVVELESVIRGAAEAARPGLESKGLQLAIDIPEGIGSVRGDPTRLRQVIWNLLSNAVKFTDSGGRIRVAAACTDSHIEIAVSDTGQGIEPAFMPCLFERFRQADASAARRHGGLGLGLSIVRSLVELHGGTVRAASPGRGQGATFTVTLPAATPLGPDAVSDDYAQERAGLVGVDFESITLHGLTVLAVDDQRESLELVRRVLEERQARVVMAKSAAEAFKILQQLRPDVLVSDIGMPDEDGHDLLRWVRALPVDSGGAIPAIALTAFAGVEDRQRAIACGYQAHVPKPVDVAQLITIVAGLVGRIKYFDSDTERLT